VVNFLAVNFAVLLSSFLEWLFEKLSGSFEYKKKISGNFHTKHPENT